MRAARFGSVWPKWLRPCRTVNRLHSRTLWKAAYKARTPLFAHGFYRTPEIHFDPKTATGKPFHYYAFAAAVSEVEIDGFTGGSRVLRTDILEDVGDSVSPLVDRGQIEGGFIQGLGWLTLEELVWDKEGRLATNGASTYKLPSWTEMPQIFKVAFLERAAEPGVIFGSKAVGEPPLMLVISVREAIRDADCGVRDRAVFVTLDSPATPERIFWAIEAARSAGQNRNRTHCGSGSRVTIFRSSIFHTPANAFTTPDALVALEDGALAIEAGKDCGVR